MVPVAGAQVAASLRNRDDRLAALKLFTILLKLLKLFS